MRTISNLEFRIIRRIMEHKFRAVLLCCLCFAVPNWSGPQLALAQSDSSYKVRVDVDLATVDVVALDKKGNPVRNLKKEDFQLYEDGKKQEIVSMDEVNAESEASSLGVSPINAKPSHRGKTVLIIFNDSAIRPEFIQESRDSAQKFVKEHMRPQDLFAVADFGMSMKVLQNFTSDREEVMQAIANAAPANAGGGSMYFENLVLSLEGINQAIAHIKGQKTILIYSQPNTGMARDNGTQEKIYNRTLASAKKSNIMIYTINPDEQNIGSSPAGTPSIGNAGRTPTGAARGPGSIFTQNLGGARAGLTLRSLAAESGGTTFDHYINEELDQLDQKLSNYYILGFRSNNPRRDGAFRKLEVKTELKGVSLKHAAGYQDRRPIDVLASAKQEKNLLTALASPGAAAQLPIVFRPLYFYDSPRVARVLVVSRISMEKVAFKKKGGQLGTDLNIMGVAYAEDGSMAARFSETLPVSFDKDKESEFRTKGLAYRNYFKLRPGKYRLKLAVSDESDDLGSMEQLLDVPALPDRGFAGSSIVIAEQTSAMPDLIKNLQTQLLDEENPLLFSGVQIEPRVENRLPAGANIPLVFRVYNLPGPHDQWDLTAKIKLLEEKGQAYNLPPIPLKTITSPAGKAEALVALTISLPSVPPGKYRLIIETGEPGSQDTATLQTDLEFVK